MYAHQVKSVNHLSQCCLHTEVPSLNPLIQQKFNQSLTINHFNRDAQNSSQDSIQYLQIQREHICEMETVKFQETILSQPQKTVFMGQFVDRSFNIMSVHISSSLKFLMLLGILYLHRRTWSSTRKSYCARSYTNFQTLYSKESCK